jgi:hypothetical protein
MQTFTFGTTPEHVIRDAFAREIDGHYRMEARGIDAVTLDAVGGPATLDADGLVHLLAMLADFPESPDVDTDRYSVPEIIENAFSLRTSILSTLGIEEI